MCLRVQELEQNRKSVREYEIKYKKLESIFDQEREKMNGERSRAKTEITALKKIAEDAEELLKTTAQELKKKESNWKTDKANLEREIASLKKQVLASRSGEGSEHEDKGNLLLGASKSSYGTEEEWIPQGVKLKICHPGYSIRKKNPN
ncbi:hypothetical protein ANCDUO_06497 [Ancylostoma duodenale]|uniref:Uncharacterized protein n=1 Tax=Ancylostoma duodenale TaxID=51022 RepID=A0A0C2GVX8_9BILA|nr:hypothetical protein ANCDUO_06497 [Ancylostoma duodenale]